MVSPEALVVLGFAIIFVTVGIGLLVSSWPRPDTRQDAPHKSLTDMVRDSDPRVALRAKLDRELRAQQRYGQVVDEREVMRDEGDAL